MPEAGQGIGRHHHTGRNSRGGVGGPPERFGGGDKIHCGILQCDYRQSHTTAETAGLSWLSRVSSNDGNHVRIVVWSTGSWKGRDTYFVSMPEYWKKVVTRHVISLAFCNVSYLTELESPAPCSFIRNSRKCRLRHPWLCRGQRSPSITALSESKHRRRRNAARTNVQIQVIHPSDKQRPEVGMLKRAKHEVHRNNSPLR